MIGSDDYYKLAGPHDRVIGVHYLEHHLTTSAREDMTNHYDKDQDIQNPIKKADYLSSVLLNLLLQMMQGPAYIVTRAMLDNNGCEALRRLQAHFGKTKRQMAISMLMRIVRQKFDENRLVEQLTMWNFEISECEGITTERLPNLLKTTLLILNTSGGMYRYLCMQVNNLANYQRTKASVVK